MRLFSNIIFAIIFVVVVEYLLLPTPHFPLQPPDSVQSLEDADTESPLRRAYFTNFTREQAISHYQSQMEHSILFGIPMLTYRLNHPPEDAFRLVRDQTRSTYLEEIVHPLRESLIVNGFQPREAKDAIGYRGVRYDQKITIQYAPSATPIRLFLFGIGMLMLWSILRELSDSFQRLTSDWFLKP